FDSLASVATSDSATGSVRSHADSAAQQATAITADWIRIIGLRGWEWIAGSLSYNPGTMRQNLFSINALVLTGFLLVALPLVVALWTTHTRMGELAMTTSAAFERGVAAARDTQLLMEQLPQFERNVRQYRVVSDPTYRALAQERHGRLLQV